MCYVTIILCLFHVNPVDRPSKWRFKDQGPVAMLKFQVKFGCRRVQRKPVAT